MEVDHYPRHLPCALLRDAGIPSVVWFEDAIWQYGVPTVVFDLYILVPDIDTAATVLRHNRWTSVEQQFAQINSATLDMTKYPQQRLESPKPEGAEDDITTSQIAPPVNSDLTTVVLLPSSRWNYSFDTGPCERAFLPTLEHLLDALIDSQLDCSIETPEEFDLRGHLNVQIAYLYGHANELNAVDFAERMLYEHRQYHYDICAGMSYGSKPFIAHQRRIRQGLRNRTYELQECSASRDDEDLFMFNFPPMTRKAAVEPQPAMAEEELEQAELGEEQPQMNLVSRALGEEENSRVNGNEPGSAKQSTLVCNMDAELCQDSQATASPSHS